MARASSLQAGDLRNTIGFYQRASGDSPETGNLEGEFPAEPEFTRRANVAPRLGGETVLAQRLQGTKLVNITVRQTSMTRLVTTAWRAKDEKSGVLYNIRSIIDPEQSTPDRGRWLEMLCEEGVAA
jgi:head-tail adaptor